MPPTNAPARNLKGTARKFLRAKVFGIPAPLVAAGAVGAVILLRRRSASGESSGAYASDLESAAADDGGATGGAGSGAIGGGSGGGTVIGGLLGGRQPVVRRRVVRRIDRSRVTINAGGNVRYNTRRRAPARAGAGRGQGGRTHRPPRHVGGTPARPRPSIRKLGARAGAAT